MSLDDMEPEQQEALETLTSAEEEVCKEFPWAKNAVASLFRNVREALESGKGADSL